MKKKTKLDKLRVSYSLLNLWERGQTDRAISTYFHTPMEVTEPMKQGREIHQDIEKHISQYGKFPNYLPDIKLDNPQPEEKLIVEYSDMFDLSVVIDCLDIPNMYEFKSGVTDSLSHANTKQLGMYFLACELADKKASKAYLLHYNQHEETTDFTIVWNNQKVRNDARNYIDSLAPEIQRYFLKAGFLKG